MAEASLQLGNGNWAGKSGNLLAYHKANNNFYADDLTFARASTGTIVNSDGLIEEVPYNLLQYSEQFDNAVYSLTSSSISANAINSPIGTLTADKLVENTATNLHRVGQGSIPVTSGQVYTFSFYVKAAERDELELQRINTSGTVFNSISATTADLTNGTLSVGSNVTASNIASVGDGWYRISISLTAIATGSGGLNIGMEKDGNVFYAGDGVSGVYLWGFQLNSGSTAKTYYPTTTRLNIPRVDYLNNANGSLLLEPQRTNLNTYSEDIPQNYVTTEISDTFEYSTSPNGLQTSTRLQLSNLGSSRYVHTLTGIVSSGTAYTFSCYYKGTLGETAYMYALPVGGTAITKAITFNGEWQRENLTFTAGASSNYVYIVDSRQGGDASDFEVWGAQSEEGSYPTSYIPTSGTTVTRLQDTSLTSGLSSVINSVEGVIFLEMAALANDSTNRYISINDGTSSKRIIFKFGTSSNNIAALGLGTASSFSMSYSGATITNMNKIALKYKANDCALWVNGVEVATDTTFTAYAASTLSHIAFSNSSGGGQWLEANVQNLMVFPSALTDTELATLTTI